MTKIKLAENFVYLFFLTTDNWQNLFSLLLKYQILPSFQAAAQHRPQLSRLSKIAFRESIQQERIFHKINRKMHASFGFLPCLDPLAGFGVFPKTSVLPRAAPNSSPQNCLQNTYSGILASETLFSVFVCRSWSVFVVCLMPRLTPPDTTKQSLSSLGWIQQRANVKNMPNYGWEKHLTALLFRCARIDTKTQRPKMASWRNTFSGRSGALQLTAVPCAFKLNR